MGGNVSERSYPGRYYDRVRSRAKLEMVGDLDL